MAEIAQRDVRVSLAERSYSVRVGAGVLDDAGKLIADLGEPASIVLVTNPTVADLYGARVVNALAGYCDGEPLVVEIPDGERFKNIATLELIYDRALERGVDRTAVVVALGGGVVGDVAGFAAATLLRGLRSVMIPTTLLAQVDSSVGGKTGVNRPQGKNLVGAFHQPSLVLADPAALASLPEREYRAGLAEVVKYGMILDESLFVRLEEQCEAVLDRDAGVMIDVVARCVELKAQVVEQDETEAGPRRILNFGHTIGHAIEQATSYQRFLHGEAVAMGMVAEARTSQRLGACDAAVVERLENLLRMLGLDGEIPDDVARGGLGAAVSLDKKRHGDRISFIVCESIGRCRQQPLTVEAISANL